MPNLLPPSPPSNSPPYITHRLRTTPVWLSPEDHWIVALGLSWSPIRERSKLKVFRARVDAIVLMRSGLELSSTELSPWSHTTVWIHMHRLVALGHQAFVDAVRQGPTTLHDAMASLGQVTFVSHDHRDHRRANLSWTPYDTSTTPMPIRDPFAPVMTIPIVAKEPDAPSVDIMLHQVFGRGPGPTHQDPDDDLP